MAEIHVNTNGLEQALECEDEELEEESMLPSYEPDPVSVDSNTIVTEQTHHDLPELPVTSKQLYPRRSRILGSSFLISAAIDIVADSVYMSTLIYPERHYINVFYMAAFFGLSGIFTLISSRKQTLTIYMVCIIFAVFSTLTGIASFVFTCIEIANEEKIRNFAFSPLMGANPGMHITSFALRLIALVTGVISAVFETYFAYKLIHGASRTGQSYSPIVKNPRYQASDLRETEA